MLLTTIHLVQIYYHFCHFTITTHTTDHPTNPHGHTTNTPRTPHSTTTTLDTNLTLDAIWGARGACGAEVLAEVGVGAWSLVIVNWAVVTINWVIGNSTHCSMLSTAVLSF